MDAGYQSGMAGGDPGADASQSVGDEMPLPTPDPMDEMETAEVPVSLIGDAKAGKTITLKIVSVDDKSGMATVSAVSSEAPSGIKDAVSRFEE